MSAAKLPKGLPKLPPVPEGFDAWELMPAGYISSAPGVIAFTTAKRFPKVPHRWRIGVNAYGLDGLVYIRAIKRPAKLKKPKQAQAVKAKIQYVSTNGALPLVRHFVLPADAASVERMVEQVARAMAAHEYATVKGWAWRQDARCDKLWIAQSRAALASLGITSAKGRK